MASVDLIRISVAREIGTWQTSFGAVVRDYESEGAAVVAAIRQAQDLGRQGRFAAVVMPTLTSVYGPTGLIRTLPTRGRPASHGGDQPTLEEIPALAGPVPPVAAVEAPPLPIEPDPEEDRQPSDPILEPVERVVEPVEDVAVMPAPVAEVPERPGRFMRIVAALAREAEEKAPAGRSFHQTMSRLARGRRTTSLR